MSDEAGVDRRFRFLGEMEMEFKSVNEILNFAIDKEQEAVDFYSGWAEKAERSNMRDLFRSFAREEKRHKAKLEMVRDGNLLPPFHEKVMDLKIGDYLENMNVSDESVSPENMDYQDALIVAMKREKASFKLYSDLANAAGTDDLRDTFLELAQEEAKHKLYFEIEYDEHILTEN